MDAEALKIILDLHRKTYVRIIDDIYLALRCDNVFELNYDTETAIQSTVRMILDDIKELRSKAKRYDELQESFTFKELQSSKG